MRIDDTSHNRYSDMTESVYKMRPEQAQYFLDRAEKALGNKRGEAAFRALDKLEAKALSLPLVSTQGFSRFGYNSEQFQRVAPKAIPFENPTFATVPRFNKETNRLEPVNLMDLVHGAVGQSTPDQGYQMRDNYGVRQTTDAWGHPVIRINRTTQAGIERQWDVKYAGGTVFFSRADADQLNAITPALGYMPTRDPNGNRFEYKAPGDLLHSLIQNPHTDRFQDMVYGHDSKAKAMGFRGGGAVTINMEDLTNTPHLVYRDGRTVSIPKEFEAGKKFSETDIDEAVSFIEQVHGGSGYVRGKKSSSLQDVKRIADHTLLSVDDGQYTGSKNAKHMYLTMGIRSGAGNYLFDTQGNMRPRMSYLAADTNAYGAREGNLMRTQLVASRLMFGEGVGYAKQNNLFIGTPRQEQSNLSSHGDLRQGDVFVQGDSDPVMVPEGGRVRNGSSIGATKLPMGGLQTLITHVSRSLNDLKSRVIGVQLDPLERAEFKQFSMKNVLVPRSEHSKMFSDSFNPDVIAPLPDPGIRSRSMMDELWKMQAASDPEQVSRTDRMRSMVGQYLTAAQGLGIEDANKFIEFRNAKGVKAQRAYDWGSDSTWSALSGIIEDGGYIKFSGHKSSTNARIAAATAYFQSNLQDKTFETSMSENELLTLMYTRAQEQMGDELAEGMTPKEYQQQARAAGIKWLKENAAISNLRYKPYDGESASVSPDDIQYHDDMRDSRGTYTFDVTEKVFNAHFLSNVHKTGSKGKRTVSSEFSALIREQYPQLAPALDRATSHAQSKNSAFQMIRFAAGKMNTDDAVGIESLDYDAASDAVLPLFDGVGIADIYSDTVLKKRYQTEMLKHLGQQSGNKPIRAGGTLIAPLGVAAAFMDEAELDHVAESDFGSGYGEAALNIIGAGSSSVSGVMKEALNDQLMRIYNSPEVMSRALEPKLAALSGPAAGHRAIPEDMVIVNPNDYQQRLTENGFSKAEIKEQMKALAKGDARAIANLDPQSNFLLANPAVQLRSVEWARKNLPGLDDAVVPSGGALMSMALAQSQAKDADGDTFGVIAMPLTRQQIEKTSNITRGAWMNRGFELLSAFAKDSINSAKYLGMSNTLLPEEAIGAKKLLNQSKTQLSTKQVMGLEFNAPVRTLRDTAYLMSHKVKGGISDRLLTAAANFGQEPYQLALDSSPSADASYRDLQKLMSNGSYYGSGKFFTPPLVDGDAIKAQYTNTQYAKSGLYLNPSDKVLSDAAQKGDVERVINRHQSNPQWKFAMDEQAKESLVRMVKAGMFAEGNTDEGEARYKGSVAGPFDPSSKIKPGLIDEHARLIVPINKADDEVTVMRVKNMLLQTRSAIAGGKETDRDVVLSDYFKALGYENPDINSLSRKFVYGSSYTANQYDSGEAHERYFNELPERPLLAIAVGAQVAAQTLKNHVKSAFFGKEGAMYDESGKDTGVKTPYLAPYRMPGASYFDATTIGAPLHDREMLVDASKARQKYDSDGALKNASGVWSKLLGSAQRLAKNEFFSGAVKSIFGDILDFKDDGGGLDPDKVTVVGERGPEIVHNGKVYPNSVYNKLFGKPANVLSHKHQDKGMNNVEFKADGDSVWDDLRLSLENMGRSDDEVAHIQKLYQANALGNALLVPAPARTESGTAVVPDGFPYQMNTGAYSGLFQGAEDPILSLGVGITKNAESATPYDRINSKAGAPGQIDRRDLQRAVVKDWLSRSIPSAPAAGTPLLNSYMEARAQFQVESDIRPARSFSGNKFVPMMRDTVGNGSGGQPPVPPDSFVPSGSGNPFDPASNAMIESYMTKMLQPGFLREALGAYGRIEDSTDQLAKRVGFGSLADLNLSSKDNQRKFYDALSAYARTTMSDAAIEAVTKPYYSAKDAFNVAKDLSNLTGGASENMQGLEGFYQRIGDVEGVINNPLYSGVAGALIGVKQERDRIRTANTVDDYEFAGARGSSILSLKDISPEMFRAAVTNTDGAQRFGKSVGYSYLKQAFGNIEKFSDLSPDLVEKTGYSMGELGFAYQTMKRAEARGVTGANIDVSAETPVDMNQLDVLSQRLGEINGVFANLGKTTEMLTSQKREYAKNLSFVNKSFEEMDKNLQTINEKEQKWGQTLTDTEKNFRSTVTSGPVGEAMGKWRDNKQAIDKDFDKLAADRGLATGASDKYLSAQLNEMLLERGPRGRKMRESMEFKELIEQGYFQVGGREIRDEGTARTLGAGMRLSNSISGMMFGATMLKYNIIDPGLQSAEKYIDNQRQAGDSLVARSGMTRSDLLGSRYDLAQRYAASQERFGLGFGESMATSLSGLLNSRSSSTLGRAAGDAASVFAPGFAGAMLASSFAPALALPAALIGTGVGIANFVGTRAGNRALVSSSRASASTSDNLLEVIYNNAMTGLGRIGMSDADFYSARAEGDETAAMTRYFNGTAIVGTTPWDMPATASKASSMRQSVVDALSTRYDPASAGQIYDYLKRTNTLSSVGYGDLMNRALSIDTAMTRGFDVPTMQTQMFSAFGMSSFGSQGYGGFTQHLEAIANMPEMTDPAVAEKFTGMIPRISQYGAMQDYYGYRHSTGGYTSQWDPGRAVNDSLSIALGRQPQQYDPFTVVMGNNQGVEREVLSGFIDSLKSFSNVIQDLDPSAFAESNPAYDVFANGVNSGDYSSITSFIANTGRYAGAYQSARNNTYGQWDPVAMGNILGAMPNVGVGTQNLLLGALQGDATALTAISQTSVGQSAGFNFNMVDLETGQSPYARGISVKQYADLQSAARKGGYDMGKFGSYTDVHMGTVALESQYADKMYSYQMAGMGIQAAQARTQFAFMTGGTRQLDAQGFAVGGNVGQAVNRQGFNAGNGMGIWQVQDAMTRIQREKQDWQMQQQGIDLDFAQAGQDMQMRQFMEKWDFGWDWMKTTTRRNRQEMKIGRAESLTQRAWQAEDMALNQNMADLQYGWQQQDFDRNLRYARGRDRIDLMREQSRSAVMFSLQQTGRDNDKERFQEQSKWADERYDRERKFFELTAQHNRDEMKMEKRHFLERMGMEQDRLDRSRANFEKEKKWLEEQRKLEDQSRLLERQQAVYMNDFHMASIGLGMKAAEETKKFQDLMKGLQIGEDVIMGVAKMNVQFGLMPGLVEKVVGKVRELEQAILRLPAVQSGGKAPSDPKSIGNDMSPKSIEVLREILNTLKEIEEMGPGRVHATIYTKEESINTKDIMRSAYQTTKKSR